VALTLFWEFRELARLAEKRGDGMTDLSIDDFERFIDALARRIGELTGLPPAVAIEVADSAVPPYNTEEGMIVLRDEAMREVARVSEADLDPYGLLDSQGAPAGKKKKA
jgi:hypothetical protein